MPVGVLPCDIFSMGAAAAAGGQKSSHTFNGSSSSSRSGQGYYWVGIDESLIYKDLINEEKFLTNNKMYVGALLR